MGRDPTVDPCHCRPGYKCGYCEREEYLEAKERAERKEAEQMAEELRGDE